MKRNIKVIFLLFIFVLGFTSCVRGNINIKFDDDINVYENKEIKQNDILFEVSDNNKVLANNVLEIDFNLKITNKTGSGAIINLKDTKAYGNDYLLKENVLENDNNIFSDKEFSVDNNATKELLFVILIKDGNKDALYKIEFLINNVKANIHSYEEGYKLDKFIYVHNPLLNENVLKDAEYDASAYFGFKPNQTGSLKGYLEYDWTNEEAVLGYKNERIKYVDGNDKKIKELEIKLRNENKTIEEIARACSTLRNELRLEAYKDDPEGLKVVKERNLEKYGHEEGPLPDELFVKYGSWEKVLEKCYSTNPGMDACCGVYDMYFYLYNI